MATLCELLGLPPLEAEDTDQFALLVEALELALEGEVRVPIETWATWSMIERQALALAGRRLHAARAAQQALALMGPEGLTTVIATVDGGEAAAQLREQEAERQAAAEQAKEREREPRGELLPVVALLAGRGVERANQEPACEPAEEGSAWPAAS